MLVANESNDSLIRLFSMISQELSFVSFSDFSVKKVEDNLPDTLIFHTTPEKFIYTNETNQLAINLRLQGIPLLCVFPPDTDPMMAKECSKKGATQTIILPLIKEELLSKLHNIRKIKEIFDNLSVNVTDDEQTGLYNILYFHRALTFFAARALKYCIPLTCILIELDQYSDIVNKFSQEAMTILLKKHADIIGMTKKFNDSAFRYGKDAFLILCMNADLDLAYEQAEAFRSKLGNRRVNYNGETISSTVSIGVSILEKFDIAQQPGINLDEIAIEAFLANAFEFSSKAKMKGGDQIVCQSVSFGN